MALELGVFIPVGNNGWIISKNSPQYLPTFELNRQIYVRKRSGPPSGAAVAGLPHERRRATTAAMMRDAAAASPFGGSWSVSPHQGYFVRAASAYRVKD